jgi:outer membrane lipoprotein LolB
LTARLPQRLFAVLLSTAMLAACAPAPPRGDIASMLERQSAREARLAAQGDWSFVGRIAVSQGSNGGSGRIEWRQHGADFDISLSAPITRQTWRLSSTNGLVRLQGLPDGVREGADAEAMLQEATGWRIPIADMAAWARGARGNGAAEMEFAASGLPETLKQSGWVVTYRDWNQDSGLPLPTKMFAAAGDARVRLAVERWQAP